MLQFGLRLGARPRNLVTTTPRPVPLIRRLLADPRTVVSRAQGDQPPRGGPSSKLVQGRPLLYG